MSFSSARPLQNISTALMSRLLLLKPLSVRLVTWPCVELLMYGLEIDMFISTLVKVQNIKTL